MHFPFRSVIRTVLVIHVGLRLGWCPTGHLVSIFFLDYPEKVALFVPRISHQSLISAQESGDDLEVVQVLFAYALIDENNHVTTVSCKGVCKCSL